MTISLLDRKTTLSIFDRMLMMRYFEEAVLRLYNERRFASHFHLYIGQEATGAAVLEALGDKDLICTTHRNHGHLIGRGSDPGQTIAEILGRSTGLNRGRGGTLHASDPSRGFLSTSAIVGGCAGLAAGAAFGIKTKRETNVAVAAPAHPRNRHRPAAVRCDRAPRSRRAVLRRTRANFARALGLSQRNYRQRKPSKSAKGIDASRFATMRTGYSVFASARQPECHRE